MRSSLSHIVTGDYFQLLNHFIVVLILFRHNRYRFMGSARWTSWIALGDYEVLDGVLVVCEHSHDLVGKESLNHHEELPEVCSRAFLQSQTWSTSNFRAGDMLLFDIRTIHASTPNFSSNFRLSLDLRWTDRTDE